MKLYSYFQSSGAWRVRIALALKGLKAEMAFVNLLKNEQKSPAYAAVNPQMLVPSFVDDDGNVLTQSLAIIEYLEEQYPQAPLLPVTLSERARVRAVAYAMAQDIAPLNNLKIRKYVTSLHLDEKEWIQRWSYEGLRPLEQMLSQSPYTGSFCHGASPTLADCVLVPQLFHARRFGCDLSAYPTLSRIDATCAALPAFIAAHPANQEDAA